MPSDSRIQEAIAKFTSNIPIKVIDHLFAIYGARALEVLELTIDNPDLRETLNTDVLDIKAQIVFAVEQEFAHNLIDILRRRTTLAMSGEYGLNLLPEVIGILQKHCGWTLEQCDRAVDDYRFYMEHNCIPDYQINQKAQPKVTMQ